MKLNKNYLYTSALLTAVINDSHAAEQNYIQQASVNNWDTTSLNWMFQSFPTTWIQGNAAVFSAPVSINVTDQISISGLTYSPSELSSHEVLNITGNPITLQQNTLITSGIKNNSQSKLVMDVILQGTGNANFYGYGISLLKNNTYTGGSTLKYANIDIAGSSPFGIGDIFVNSGSTLSLLRAHAAKEAIINNNIIINSGATLNFSGDTAGVMIFNGVISGDGGLNINGKAHYNLNNKNTYTGSTIINNSTVSVGNEEAFGKGDVIIGDNTKLTRSTLNLDALYNISNNFHFNKNTSSLEFYGGKYNFINNFRETTARNSKIYIYNGAEVGFMRNNTLTGNIYL